MEEAVRVLARSDELISRATSTDPHGNRPPVYKAIGISLAIASGLFIGTSFVLKKTGLLKANVKYNEEAGEGYGYLKNAYWWTGMTLMIIGEICNFVAYAFVDAILVTPLGALSVVITTILSAIFLKERLSFVGKVGCFQCIVGSVVIVMNAPAQSSAATIQDMKHFVIAPGFLTYAGVVIVGSAFIALWAGPRYGKKSMLVYLTVCSLIGGLSVVATQGLGAAVVTQIAGTPQFNQWFLYVLLVFVIATLVTEIIFLNKALNLFNAALVTPTYYVYFTSSTIVTSAILFQGFKGTPTSIVTVVLGFFVICSGVVLLQLSKSAKDVPDTAVFKGDLDQVRTVAEQEEPESEPKADAIRGAAALVRRISQARQKKEAAEAKRVHEDRMKDRMEPIGEDEQVQWDGLRRRKTTLESNRSGGSLQRQKTIHPPLGMAHFPDDDSIWNNDSRPASTDVHGGGGFHGKFMPSFGRKHSQVTRTQSLNADDPMSPSASQKVMQSRPNTTIAALPPQEEDIAYHGAHSGDGAMELDTVHGSQYPFAPPSPNSQGRPIMWSQDVEDAARLRGLSAGSSIAPTPPPHGNKRQFSFQNVFHRHHKDDPKKPASSSSDRAHSFYPSEPVSSSSRPTSRLGIGKRRTSNKDEGAKTQTEEERLGLVKGDSNNMLQLPEYTESPLHSDNDSDDWVLENKSSLLPEVARLDRETSRTPLIAGEQYGYGEGEQDDGEKDPRQDMRNTKKAEDDRGKWAQWDDQKRGGYDGSGGGGGPPPAFI